MTTPPMKIHIAGIATETNTFASTPTGWAAWEVDHGYGRTAEAQRWHGAGRRLAASPRARPTRPFATNCLRA
jgi:microcystin degradation protein MlrC